MGLKESVDNIIQARKNDIPKVDDKLETVKKVRTAISNIRSSIEGLDEKHDLDQYIEKLNEAERKVCSLKTNLENVKGRFSRETINIGVSGGARVGKSTLLQTLTGLGDDVIPSGEGEPVTAVGSVIENQAEGENQYAKVEFYTEEEFLENRVKPLIKGFEGVEGTIKSLEDFIKKELPDVDPKNDSHYARKNVQKGKFEELQRYYSSYKNLLGTSFKSVDLKDIKSYVSYPKEKDANDVYYPAVKSVHIYTHFSSLSDGVKLMLIDLPGFGEIGGVDEIQLKSLNTDIDHAIRIARPDSSQNAYCGEQLAKISESLAKVQPEVKENRKCLFSYVVNVDKSNKNYETLSNTHIEGILKSEKEIFQRGVNLEIISVIDKEETNEMFNKMLNSMVSNMYKLDEDFINACDTSEIVFELKPVLEKISQESNNLRKYIPTSHEKVTENARKLRGAISEALDRAEDEWKDKKDPFFNEINAKKDEIDENIKGNLYCDDKVYPIWDDYARSELLRANNQYKTLVNEECIRLRIKILDEYESLSRDYEKALSEVKEGIIKAFRDNLGNLPDKDKRGIDSIQDILFKIEKQGHRVERIVECLNWLRDLNVDFMQQIYPSFFVKDGKDDMFDELNSNKNDFKAENTGNRDLLVAEIKSFLQAKAKRVNYELRKSLVSDSFYGMYLSCSISYFHDKLIRYNRYDADRNFENLYYEFQDLINSEDNMGLTDDEKIISSIYKNALDLSGILNSWGGK